MKTHLPISVFTIAKNEADRIHYTISSVNEWVDEVIVIDSGSTHNTVEVCKSYGATVLFNEWRGYGLKKSFGEAQCKNDWVLNLDADEEVTKELQNEIISIINKRPQKFTAYTLPFLPFSERTEYPYNS
ncbi:MAG: glycosyltransferase family 2 protein [Candidatus Sedimenticola sp. (ex Thyasira tokunagai)]